MATLYTSNFDSATTGNIAPGWANITGTWTVGTTRPISTTKSFGEATANDTNVVLLNQGAGASGMAAVADCLYTYNQQVLTTSGAGANILTMCPVLRSDATFANAYFIKPVTNTATWQVVKRVASVNSNVGATIASGYTIATSDIVKIKTAISSIAIMFKVWKSTSTEPAAWSGVIYDNSIVAAGFPGIYMYANGGSALAAQSFDDFTVTDLQYTGTITGIPNNSNGAKITANALTVQTGIPGSSSTPRSRIQLFKRF